MSIELSKVFYNLIPGSIYLALWVYLYFGSIENIKIQFERINLDINGTFTYIIFVIISIFVGYLLNAVWRVFRRCICAEDCAKNYRGGLAKIDIDIIHQRHSELWYRGKESLSEHFSAIAAMWGNFVVGSGLTVVFFSFFPFNKYIIISQIVLLPLAYCFFIEFKHASYHSIWRQSIPLREEKYK